MANEWWSAQLVLGQSNVSGVRANATFVNLQANQSASTPRPGWGMLSLGLLETLVVTAEAFNGSAGADCFLRPWGDGNAGQPVGTTPSSRCGLWYRPVGGRVARHSASELSVEGIELRSPLAAAPLGTERWTLTLRGQALRFAIRRTFRRSVRVITDRSPALIGSGEPGPIAGEAQLKSTVPMYSWLDPHMELNRSSATGFPYGNDQENPTGQCPWGWMETVSGSSPTLRIEPADVAFTTQRSAGTFFSWSIADLGSAMAIGVSTVNRSRGLALIECGVEPPEAISALPMPRIFSRSFRYFSSSVAPSILFIDLTFYYPASWPVTSYCFRLGSIHEWIPGVLDEDWPGIGGNGSMHRRLRANIPYLHAGNTSQL